MLHMKRKHAFTLVELLVVIGIIAVLVGILLPVLGRAREQARAIKCTSNVRSSVQAVQVYAAEEKDWLPGPHTSGYVWNQGTFNGSSTTVLNIDGGSNTDTINAGEAHARTTALQDVDWASPTLGKLLKLPEAPTGTDFERMEYFYNNDLLCPSNDINFTTAAFGGAFSVDPTGLRYSSYSAIIEFHTWPQQENPGGKAAGNIRISTGSGRSYIGFEAPPSYSPKLSKVGGASSKVFMVEGARYVEFSASGSVVSSDFNVFRRQVQGGNFMVRGPYRVWDNQPHWLGTASLTDQTWDGTLKPGAKTHAYRHNEKMNLGFFDGHVELRHAGNTIDPRLYLPRGTKSVGIPVGTGKHTYAGTEMPVNVVID